MSLNFVSFDFQRNTNNLNTDVNKVVVKPKKKQVSKQPAKTKVKT